jgi:hypothetical protein
LAKLGKLLPCKNVFIGIAKNRKIYEDGWNRVQEDIDLVNIVKELRTLRFINKSLLSNIRDL